MPQPPSSTLFPYTTLFRSLIAPAALAAAPATAATLRVLAYETPPFFHPGADGKPTGIELEILRSEEHTSELQSRLQLVCRLLPEKKKLHSRTPTSSGSGAR